MLADTLGGIIVMLAYFFVRKPNYALVEPPLDKRLV
jgi:hypothetical protein